MVFLCVCVCQAVCTLFVCLYCVLCCTRSARARARNEHRINYTMQRAAYIFSTHACNTLTHRDADADTLTHADIIGFVLFACATCVRVDCGTFLRRRARAGIISSACVCICRFASSTDACSQHQYALEKKPAQASVRCARTDWEPPHRWFCAYKRQAARCRHTHNQTNIQTTQLLQTRRNIRDPSSRCRWFCAQAFASALPSGWDFKFHSALRVCRFTLIKRQTEIEHARARASRKRRWEWVLCVSGYVFLFVQCVLQKRSSSYIFFCVSFSITFKKRDA